MKMEFLPLTRERWSDLEELFGERGACGGCWCMWWRLKRSVFNQQKGEGNRRAMKAIVRSGEIPGILAYFDGRPIGWCSVAPRETFTVLDRSRVLKKIDDLPVWSIVCFFIDKKSRNQGVTIQLLEAAIDHVRKKEGKVLEGYPIDPGKKRVPGVFAYTGFLSAFKEAGFTECARRSETRPIMRLYIQRMSGA